MLVLPNKYNQFNYILLSSCWFFQTLCSKNGLNDRVCVHYGNWMVGWLDGWMVGWLDGWMVGWLDGWMVGWLDFGWLDGWTMNNEQLTIRQLSIFNSRIPAII